MSTTTLPSRVETLLSETSWSDFGTTQGAATNVPLLLRQLFSDCELQAAAAAQALNDLLCPQHVKLASASLPALPVIVYALGWLKDRSGLEQLVHVLVGFSQACAATSWEFGPPDYLSKLRRSMEESRSMLTSLTTHDSIRVAEQARAVLEHLDRAKAMYGWHDESPPVERA